MCQSKEQKKTKNDTKANEGDEIEHGGGASSSPPRTRTRTTTFKQKGSGSKISPPTRIRRDKREKQASVSAAKAAAAEKTTIKFVSKKKIKSKSFKKYEGEQAGGGIEALIPSLIGIGLLVVGIVAKMGWRGRANVAGIDLGTTNSVICVQQQSKGVGKIECIPDPFNNSPIVPSVISIIDPHESYSKQHKSSRTNTNTNSKTGKKQPIQKDELGYDLKPHPFHVMVGSAAKSRIDTHPHHTLYHAKRVLGHSFDADAVKELAREVEFDVINNTINGDDNNNNSGIEEEQNGMDVAFRVPFHSKTKSTGETTNHISLQPHQVGSFVVYHLMQMTDLFLGHNNVRSAVIAVPAKFDSSQRRETVKAFKEVGVKVTRILEEPVAAALAYGLQQKEDVDYILVYDFGGGTLDVSVLQVFEGGYVEVVGNDGDNRLGGADFDAAVAHSLLDWNNGAGADVVKKVATVLNGMEDIFEEQHASSGGKSGDDKEDIEELLSAECPRLSETPLCTLSSFHTMGEKMKIELSSFVDEDAIVHSTCLGFPADANPQRISDFCSMLEPVELTLTSKQYDTACESLFERALIPVQRILKELDLKTDEIDEVVMVGGTTRMPQVRKMVQKELRVEALNTSIDPDLTVAYGAASVID
jgi:molecular chaperone DnaK (HSP70)